jgi:hypothetical protein
MQPFLSLLICLNDFITEGPHKYSTKRNGFINERVCLLKFPQSLTDNPTLDKPQNVLEESRYG